MFAYISKYSSYNLEEILSQHKQNYEPTDYLQLQPRNLHVRLYAYCLQ